MSVLCSATNVNKAIPPPISTHSSSVPLNATLTLQSRFRLQSVPAVSSFTEQFVSLSICPVFRPSHHVWTLSTPLYLTWQQSLTAPPGRQSVTVLLSVILMPRVLWVSVILRVQTSYCCCLQAMEPLAEVRHCPHPPPRTSCAAVCSTWLWKVAKKKHWTYFYITSDYT